MKRMISALALPLLVSANAPAAAKTASGKIAVSAQIVPGNSVSAFLTAGSVTTVVNNDRSGAQAAPPGAASLLHITFDLDPSWVLVKRVTWDKQRQHLTIDF